MNDYNSFSNPSSNGNPSSPMNKIKSTYHKLTRNLFDNNDVLPTTNASMNNDSQTGYNNDISYNNGSSNSTNNNTAQSKVTNFICKSLHSLKESKTHYFTTYQSTPKHAMNNIKSAPRPVITSYLSLFIVLCVLFNAFYNIKDYSEYTKFECTRTSCTLSENLSAKFNGNVRVHAFSRDRLERSIPVRISKGGGIVNTAGMKRKELRRLGFSYALVYTEVSKEEENEAGDNAVFGSESEIEDSNSDNIDDDGADEQKVEPRNPNGDARKAIEKNKGTVIERLVSRRNMGKRSSKTLSTTLNLQINRSIKGDRSPIFVESKAQNSVFNILCIVFCGMAGCVLMVIGEFSSDEYRKMYEGGGRKRD